MRSKSSLGKERMFAQELTRPMEKRIKGCGTEVLDYNLANLLDPRFYDAELDHLRKLEGLSLRAVERTLTHLWLPMEAPLCTKSTGTAPVNRLN